MYAFYFVCRSSCRGYDLAGWSVQFFITNTVFHSLPVGGFGGHVLMADGTLLVSDCIFNNAGDPAAPEASNIVSWATQKQITILRCIFRGTINKAALYGVNFGNWGAYVTIRDSVFATNAIGLDGAQVNTNSGSLVC